MALGILGRNLHTFGRLLIQSEAPQSEAARTLRARLIKRTQIRPVHPTESHPTCSRCARDPPHNHRNVWPSWLGQHCDRHEDPSSILATTFLAQTLTREMNFRTGTTYVEVLAFVEQTLDVR